MGIQRIKNHCKMFSIPGGWTPEKGEKKHRIRLQKKLNKRKVKLEQEKDNGDLKTTKK